MDGYFSNDACSQSDLGPTTQANGARRPALGADDSLAIRPKVTGNSDFIPRKEQDNDRQDPSGR